ncbi:MAG: peptide/nickel transport system ATP-binding protein [Deferribacteres bacterium]|nr:transporter ATP-binding protein [Deferribacteraceae bacterium]MDK2792279.1 peptide/nickel transport system ATP-binding protein [Deferribacteres bacterium]
MDILYFFKYYFYTMLEIRNLNVILENINKRFYILRDISFSLEKKEILGLVGESGSGKTILGKTILGLIKSPLRKISGEIYFKEEKINEENIKNIRGKKISMIFQNPTASLNPVFTIENQLIETIKNSARGITYSEAKERAVNLLKKVEIDNPLHRLKNYPHNLSGGMNQRVMIALALASNPEILIADEPTTALDVTVQANIINLLKMLNSDMGLSIIFITHDLSLIKKIADRVAVIYAGEIVEVIEKDRLIAEKFRHPYSMLLNKCIPGLHSREEKLTTIPGEITQNTEEYENKCIFYERCPVKIEICRNKKPVFKSGCKCFNPVSQ